MTEFWTLGIGLPGWAVRQATAAEHAGWDGIAFVDSQNLSGDPYIAMALAASATNHILLGTGVTNPYTRHAAVAATAIATVHAQSHGRAVLGIGRGDSALAHLGLAPAPVGVFERYLSRLQGYLRGDEVPFDEPGTGDTPAPVSALGLAVGPKASRLQWLPATLAKVPVDVAATGPRVIALGARLAERVTFAVGAEPDRVSWAMGVAREARAAAGLDPDAVSLGAYVNVVVEPDRETAKALVSGGLASFARFSVMHGRATGPVTVDDREVLESVHRVYDMTGHTRSGTAQAEALSDEFVDRFAIVGTAEHCTSRLRELIDLGLQRIAVIGPSIGADREAAARARARFQEEVLPALRAGA
jgi:5,10-methylenetetrahydromethanopterin reductase